MTILGLDASGPACSAALMKDGVVLAAMQQNAGLTHSQTLMPMLEQVLCAANQDVASLDLIACVAGPGSFTGVRIGVCAAKALAHAHNIACVQINALEALAMDAYGFCGTICPMLDARRGQVYCASFRFEAGELPVREMADGAMALETYLDSLPKEGKLLFVGDGLKAHGGAVRTRLGDRALLAPPNRSQLTSSAACALAAAGGGVRTDYAGLSPIYLRQSQAERERLEKGES